MMSLQYQYRPGMFTGWIAGKLARHAKRRRRRRPIRVYMDGGVGSRAAAAQSRVQRRARAAAVADALHARWQAPRPSSAAAASALPAGCFDLMHYGHANALRQAKALGDELVVCAGAQHWETAGGAPSMAAGRLPGVRSTAGRHARSAAGLASPLLPPRRASLASPRARA